MSEYPEHDKLKEVKDKSQTIGEFLEWCSDQRIRLCSMDSVGDYWPIRESTEELLARRFDVNLVKLEKEKQAMLNKLRGGADGAR